MFDAGTRQILRQINPVVKISTRIGFIDDDLRGGALSDAVDKGASREIVAHDDS